MTLEEIRQLIDLANESGIAELEVERGGNRVRIRRVIGGHPQEIVLHPSHNSAPVAGPMPAAPPHPPAPEVKTEDAQILVRSPIVGTFYEGPSPGAPPFVKPGDQVQPGQVLCIIESMKLMNEIEAEVSGVIVAKLVDNAKPVEYGEALFSLRSV